MRRSDFLSHVGDPKDTIAQAFALEDEAQRLWATVRAEFFTAAGKPRTKPASLAAQHTRGEVDRLRERARQLHLRAHDQRSAHDQLWSHIEPMWLRKFGLDDVAARVEEARRHFVAQAEAA